MPILTMFEFHGDPEDLLAKMDGHAEDASELAGETGNLFHSVVGTDEGLMVINLWEDEDGMARFASVIGPKAREAGLTEQVGYRKLEVLRHRSAG